MGFAASLARLALLPSFFGAFLVFLRGLFCLGAFFSFFFWGGEGGLVAFFQFFSFFLGGGGGLFWPFVWGALCPFSACFGCFLRGFVLCPFFIT